MNSSGFSKLSAKLLQLNNCSNFGSARAFGFSKANNLRFVQFHNKDRPSVQHLGAQVEPDGEIFNLSAVDSTIPNTLLKFLAGEKDAYQKARRIIARGKCMVPANEIVLLPPITKPDKIACIGHNYGAHCDEQNKPRPKEPLIFSKFSSCIVGPNDNIKLPTISQMVDWEVELAIIIGRKAKNIRIDQADDVIFGYTVAQDISARDWQKERNYGQFLLGKSMDTFCPLGPVVVTKDQIDPEDLSIKSWVNGNLKQTGNTNEMIFKPTFLVSYLSEIVTLYPGDVILSGTPSGVGVHRNPPQFLQKGDLLESEIEGIGKLSNLCI